MGRAKRLAVWVRGRRQPRRRVFRTPAWLHESGVTHVLKWLDRGGRGNFLTVFGLIYLLLGQGYLTTAHPVIFDTLPGVGFMPVEAWGGVWIAAGAVAVASGLLYSPARDRWGFLALSCLAFWWGMSFLAGWLTGDVETGWRNALIYWAFAAASLIMAGMIDPATVDRMKVSDAQRCADGPGDYPSVQS